MATPNIFDINNIKDLLGNSLIPIIKDSKCNGKDCYYIKTSKIKNLVTGNEPIEIYIEKATGLPIRILQGPISTANDTTNTIVDFDYNFNNVNDDNLKITDIEQYKIQK